MNSETIVYCVVSFLIGMLLAHMLKSVCGCNKVVEGVPVLFSGALGDFNPKECGDDKPCKGDDDCKPLSCINTRGAATCCTTPPPQKRQCSPPCTLPDTECDHGSGYICRFNSSYINTLEKLHNSTVRGWRSDPTEVIKYCNDILINQEPPATTQ
mgnify:CR=1 FL=1